MADPVYLRGAPPWPFGASPREARAFVLYTGVDPTNLGSHEGKGYLLVATPFDPTLTLDIPGPPLPFGCSDRRTPRSFTSQGRSVAIYPAATGNAARSSAASDTPAATWVPGRLSGQFNYEISLFSGAAGGAAAGGAGAGQATLGILELADPDGALDGLRNLGWDSAPVELRRGDPVALFSSYVAVAKLSSAGIRYNVRKKEILLRDLAWQLQAAELHGDRYGGTGGTDGGAVLKGRIKPYAVGPAFNVTPVQIDASSLCYQVSCSSVLAIDAVKDGGVPLTSVGDYASYDALVAATLSASQFATCLAKGLFRLGGAPVYVVTADVRGDNDTINGIAYPHTRAQVARRIATGRGILRLRDPYQLDTQAFDYLDQWQTATVGFYWDGEMTKAAALDEVMAGCAGWWTTRLNGTLAVGQLEDPAGQAPLFALSYPSDVPAGESRVDEPAMTDYQAPRRSTLVGWQRNYTPLATNQIAGSVAQATVAILQAAAQYTTSEDIWVSSGFPSAAVVTLFGGFSAAADAQREGDRQRKLFRTRREPFAIAAVIDPFADVTGRIIQINNSGRLGLGSSRNFFCTGIAVNGNTKPVLKLWG